MCAVPARVRFLGHSTVSIDLDGTRILTDPLLVERLGPLHRRSPAMRDVITSDVVLISHGYHDHLHLPSLRLLGGQARLIVPRGLGSLLARRVTSSRRS